MGKTKVSEFADVVSTQTSVSGFSYTHTSKNVGEKQTNKQWQVDCHSCFEMIPGQISQRPFNLVNNSNFVNFPDVLAATSG